MGIAVLLFSQTVNAQNLSVEDQKYIEQVASENAPKTNAKVVTLHVKKVKNASSADTTEAEKREKFAGIRLAFTLLVEEAIGLVYQFKTDGSSRKDPIVFPPLAVPTGLRFFRTAVHVLPL